MMKFYHVVLSGVPSDTHAAEDQPHLPVKIKTPVEVTDVLTAAATSAFHAASILSPINW